MRKVQLGFFGCIVLFFGIWAGDRWVLDAAQTKSDWKVSYEEMRAEMEKESRDVLEEEITDKTKEEVSEEDWDTALISYDIKNAIPVWSLESDFTMIADYKKNKRDFSKLIKWENKWYIPAVTMAESDAHIFLQKEEGAYHVYGVFFDNTEVYAADTMDEIKSIVDEEVGTDVVSVKIVSIPFYYMNLLYVQKGNGKEFVLPYEAGNSNVLENLDTEAGTVYKVADFMADMDRTYDEYTEEELKEISAKKTYGGFLQPKLKSVQERDSGIVGSKIFIIFGIGGIIVAVLAILWVKRRQMSR